MNTIKNNIISLIGMTGCGKTSVGRLLAAKLGARFIDLDDEIVLRHGEIKKIFDEKGEAVFRQIEYDTLKSVIDTSSGALCVLSCGGGLPTYPSSRSLLSESTTVVWIKRSAEEVCADERVLMRPPVNGDIANYKRLLEARNPIYLGTADSSFYNTTPRETADSVIETLNLDKATEDKK